MYGFKARNYDGYIQVDGESSHLNLVYARTFSAVIPGNPYTPVTEEHATQVHLFVPPHHIMGEFVVACRGIDTHCAIPSRIEPNPAFQDPPRLTASLNPVGQPAPPAERTIEVYIFRPIVSQGGVYGVRIRSLSGNDQRVVFNSDDIPMWMVSGQIPAGTAATVPAGVGRAAVASWYAPRLGGGQAGEGGYYLAQPISHRELGGVIRPDRPVSNSLSNGSYSIVDVTNCPMPYGN